MAQNITTKSKYLDLHNQDSEKILSNIRKYINKYDCPEMQLDLSKLNILDAAKVMVLTSAYHYKKYPSGKVKCRVQNKEIEALVGAYMTRNLEVVN